MMNPAQWPGGLAYLAIFLAAAVEGEIVFVTATILAGMGRLNVAGVLIAGALGGSAGDQFYFYALRSQTGGWLSRFVRKIPRQQTVLNRIRQRKGFLIFACRFLPGLRIAIPAACAWAGVPAVEFSMLSLAGSFAWAATIVSVIAYAGPEIIASKSWWTPLLPALLLLLFFYWLGRASKSRLEQPVQAAADAAD
jgi:membrane protein DedA with SNARE-associated domain